MYAVAKNRAKDHLKRNKLFFDKIEPTVNNNSAEAYEIEIDLSGKNISDSQLQMMFAICQPVIPAEAQVGLSLRVLCGFGIEEIADAFLTNKETISKRLFRAKEKLREEQVKIEFPKEQEISKRLSTVLTTLYLLFNEGYYSLSQNTALRKDLCVEAMRLTFMLTENELTNRPEVNALLALMCFHSSRFEARTGEQGEPILYEEQDTSLWDRELIARGHLYLNKAATGRSASKYHFEAAIAYWHTMKSEEKWDKILQLYNQLLVIEYSPSAALNRTYAYAKVYGKPAAIDEALKLNVNNKYLYHCLLGYLYTGVENTMAINNYAMALMLTKTKPDKKQIENYIKQLSIKP